MNRFSPGKYRNIIISVALFLILDASVLILNFVMSFQISADAVAVNLAGRQRMLSQRSMKSLLDIEYSFFEDAERTRAIEELKRTVNLFDNTLNAFRDGGVTTDANGFPVNLTPVTETKAVQAIEDADVIWTPFLQTINQLTAESSNINSPLLNQRLDEAIAFGTANNLELLRLMNQLTVSLEQTASSKATRLRLIQTVGISLAILNFFLIMFHFVRQLRDSDEKIEAARQETQEILETVSEGLFLLDKDLAIGQQYSRELEDIFHRTDIAGVSFNELLKALISEKDMSTAESFIKLLFKPTVNQKLIGELNPLTHIEIHIPDENGQYQSKFLNFQFSRVESGQGILHVLATVSDITAQVTLEQELESARKQNEAQIEMLSTIMNANSDLMPMFIDNGMKALEKINNTLRVPSRSHVQHMGKVHEIYAVVHGFKGEAAALGLTPFVDLAHRFENQLEDLSNNEQLTGNDFLSLTVLLNQIMKQLEAAQSLLKKLSTLSPEVPTEASKPSGQIDWSHFQKLADDIAQRQGKKVDVLCSGLNDYSMPHSLASSINQLCVQFIRNAVVHGIETTEDRMAMQKPELGNINIQFCRLRNGDWRLSIRDDGAGIDINQVRERAVSMGVVTDEQSEHMDRKQIIALIFSPAFSTTKEADVDSGRGMGMNIIGDLVREQHGKINVSSRPNSGTAFTVTLPPKAFQDAEAA